MSFQACVDTKRRKAQSKPQPQPPTRNEPQSVLPICTFKKLPDGRYSIAALGEVCQLSAMVGLEYLHRVLAENGEPVCLAQRESGPRETLSAVSLGKLKATAKELEDRSSVAWQKNHHTDPQAGIEQPAQGMIN